jgi:hypothetical protein
MKLDYHLAFARGIHPPRIEGTGSRGFLESLFDTARSVVLGELLAEI